MAIQAASDFLASGGGGGGETSGYPNNPEGFVAETTASNRIIRVPGSTHQIRIPKETYSAVGDLTLGYRRIDDSGSAGGSEWIVDWTAVDAFMGGDIAKWDNAAWGRCQIIGDKIHIGIHDKAGAIAPTGKSWILRLNLATGAIEAATGIDHLITNTVFTQTQHICAAHDTSHAGYWEILSDGHLLTAQHDSTSAKVFKGIAVVEYDTDYSTVISENIYFDSDNAFMTAILHGISYITADGSLILAAWGADDPYLLAPGIGISIPGPFISSPGVDLAGKMVKSTGVSASGLQYIVDDIVYVDRTFTTGSKNLMAPAHSRPVLDQYLKDIFKKDTGVSL